MQSLYLFLNVFFLDFYIFFLMEKRKLDQKQISFPPIDS